MQIKDVERQTGLTKKAIRYYEDCGLILTERKENRYKEYSETTVEKLLQIKRLRLLEFSVEEIKRIFSDENHEAIILKKLNENESKLKQAYGVKQVLEKMLEGKSIDTLDVESLIIAEKQQTYMYLRSNHLLFGLCNVMAFVAIYFFLFSKMDSLANTSFLSLLIIQCLLFTLYSTYEGKRKKKGKSEGLLLKEIKPLERVFHFGINCITYLVAARICVDAFYAARNYAEWGESYFYVIGNIMLGVLFSLAALLLVIISFMDLSRKEFSIFQK
ncbi:MerR family transcriptional regulator [Evansella tamaricis]|uniref:MerR family transcriptional regulator n=1 Tax=Evansella tamaricis TaxID=2069301 RepID=A0ABS6JMP0_9BACI|nr:MerR family transcriptional regulator [Evansella tamaricis]MBU9714798.1 MerR family transcriptional regulator [Evansella tamaricis]